MALFTLAWARPFSRFPTPIATEADTPQTHGRYHLVVGTDDRLVFQQQYPADLQIILQPLEGIGVEHVSQGAMSIMRVHDFPEFPLIELIRHTQQSGHGNIIVSSLNGLFPDRRRRSKQRPDSEVFSRRGEQGVV